MKSSYRMWAVPLLLLTLSLAHAAERNTVQAVIPWDAEGRVFQVDTGTFMFIGAVKGVMYIESSTGDLHEAFVMCPIIQTFEPESGTTDANAYCEITASPEDVVYATLSCEGEVGGCAGKMTLTSGEGRFAGISGEGALRVRSPMRTLISDMAAGAVLRIASGLASIKDLRYSIP